MKRILFALAWLVLACARPLESPTVLKDFTLPASPEEVINFTKNASNRSNGLSYNTFGRSVEGTDLIVLKSTPKKSNDETLKVLLFAQQHGNEQSGKEASLLLIRDLAKSDLSLLTQNLEIWIVPQLNPDGGRLNERRNAKGIDLNRDHVVLEAPETRALHTLFREFMPHVTIDIHEYQPYRESWREFGGFKNFDVQVGVSTNINVSEDIRRFGLEQALPAIENHLTELGYSFHNYIVGPAPNLGRTRHSTVDFDDGRQSFSIFNTHSFIFEGLNGQDNFTDNLERRALSQFEALKALLGFLNENAEDVIRMVETGRQSLVNSDEGEPVAIRMEHFLGENPLNLRLVSANTGNDTLVIVENYHPIVKSTLSVKRPKAYLIPKHDSLLVHFLDSHRIQYKDFTSTEDGEVLILYKIGRIISSEDEELENRLPEVTAIKKDVAELSGSYYYVTTQQLHANFLVQVFEPQSMLGLAQRTGYEYLLHENQHYPILRIE